MDKINAGEQVMGEIFMRNRLANSATTSAVDAGSMPVPSGPAKEKPSSSGTTRIWLEDEQGTQRDLPSTPSAPAPSEEPTVSGGSSPALPAPTIVPEPAPEEVVYDYGDGRARNRQTGLNSPIGSGIYLR